MYSSFLICFHENSTDVYVNGLPIGVIRDGKFEIHKLQTSKRPVDIDQELLQRVHSAIQIITK